MGLLPVSNDMSAAAFCTGALANGNTKCPTTNLATKCGFNRPFAKFIFSYSVPAAPFGIIAGGIHTHKRKQING